MRRLNLSQKGFTLIELIMVMVMVTTLAGFIGNIIYYEVNTYKIVANRKESLQNSRFAFRKIATDVRQIIAQDSIFKATADSIRFKDVNNTEIAYKFTGNEILRNGDVLVDGIFAFQFSYFNNNDNQLMLPISNMKDIRSIALYLSLQVEGKTVVSHMKVTPRNF